MMMRQSLSVLCAFLLLVYMSNVNAKETSSPKKIVTQFFDLAFVQKHPIAAAKKYISATQYIQHNPEAPDGREAFIKGFAAYVESTDYRCEIKRVIADSDIVAVHSHCKESANDIGSAVVDIFRVEKERIVEHWDVLQAVPSKSANRNTMF
jgi:predicted SnoaL-like aldol condensation-catalyzing enzyme